MAVMALVCTTVGLMAIGALYAQQSAPASPARTGVALLDVAAVAREAAWVNAAIVSLKKEYDGHAAELQQESQRGNALTEQMRKLPPGPQRKQLEQDLAKLRADFELHGKRVTDQVADQESQVYHSLARQVQSELARYAGATGTQLVLRYEATPDELADPRAIRVVIQKLVVYQRDAEITPLVLDSINRASQAPTARAPAKPQGVQR
jgi:Skp family chaperone for outer membrane proteins